MAIDPLAVGPEAIDGASTPPSRVPPWGVAILGCGLMGRRRAQVAHEHPRCQVVALADTHLEVAQALAESLARDTADQATASPNKPPPLLVTRDAREALAHSHVHVVVICTPNAFLAPLALEALAQGKHVLIEKPMGATLSDAQALAEAAARAASQGTRFKVGFNHRYHPGLQRLRARFEAGALGRLTHVRICYGHGGRPGYEQEWRGQPALAGGGELTDQGVHVLDLLRWFAGDAQEVVAFTQTAAWPIAPLEDNAHAMIRYEGGVVAQVHTSWTQWKNLFRLELFGDNACLAVEGLGGSYGVETYTETRRNPQGGIPTCVQERFEQADLSWQLEWQNFLEVLEHRTSPGCALISGSAHDGLAVMRTLDALYRSAATAQVVALAKEDPS